MKLSKTQLKALTIDRLLDTIAARDKEIERLEKRIAILEAK